MARPNHEHKWSMKWSYWALTTPLATLYYVDQVEGAKPVWLEECLVCHILKYSPREVKNEPAMDKRLPK